MLTPKPKKALRGNKITSSDSNTSHWLYLILQALNAYAGRLANPS